MPPRQSPHTPGLQGARRGRPHRTEGRKFGVRLWCLIILTGLVAGLTALALPMWAAAEVPTLTVHTGQLPTSVNNCLGRADKAFSDAGVRNVQKGVRERMGEKNNAQVLVV